MLSDLAGLIVVAGAVLGALVRERRDVAFALPAQCLGLGVLLVAARAPIAGAVFGIVGLAGSALLRPEVAGWAILRGRRPFDLAVTILAVVGGAAVALSHPLVGIPAADVAIEVLIFSGVVALLLGDTLRGLSGVNALLLAGVALLVLADAAPSRSVLFLFAVAEIGVELTLSSWSVLLSEPGPAEEAGG